MVNFLDRRVILNVQYVIFYTAMDYDAIPTLTIRLPFDQHDEALYKRVNDFVEVNLFKESDIVVYGFVIKLPFVTNSEGMKYTGPNVTSKVNYCSSFVFRRD